MSHTSSNGFTPPHAQGTSQRQQQRGQASHSSSYQPGAPQGLQRRRDWLWQERVKLELQVQNLFSQEQRACADAHLLAQRKAALLGQRPKIVFQMALSGIAGIHVTPAERAYAYALERIAQEEARIQSFWCWCQAERQRLDGQIVLINTELTLLDELTI